MNDIATLETTSAVAVSAPVDPYADAVLAAYNNPSIDVSKLDKLIELSERNRSRAAQAAFEEAFAAMQPDLPVIAETGGIRDRNGAVQSTYAKWADVNEAISPVLKAHGFALRFRSEQVAGYVTITGILSARGHSETTAITLPLDTSGSKNNVQSVGSTISYGKRYTAGLLLNLTSRADVDNDKDGASEADTISVEDLGALESLIVKAKADRSQFLTFLKSEDLAKLPAANVKKAFDALNAKIKKDAAK